MDYGQPLHMHPAPVHACVQVSTSVHIRLQSEVHVWSHEVAVVHVASQPPGPPQPMAQFDIGPHVTSQPPPAQSMSHVAAALQLT